MDKKTYSQSGKPKDGAGLPLSTQTQTDPTSLVMFDGLLGQLRHLIADARSRALRAVDEIQVQTCWQVGRHIVEFEQGGAARAAYGKRLLPLLAERLTTEFGGGFDASNLRYMRLFYQAFPIRDALRHELSWTHYRLLTKLENVDARQWDMNEAAAQNWSTRALQRQMATLFYERLLLSQDKVAVAQEAAQKLAELEQSPRAFVRDPVMLEFLGLPCAGKLLESSLEQGLMDKLQAFLLELGKGFAFVARQQRISTESKDFYIDLVFYNYLLKCFVLIDLKTSELTHQDIGQMDMYVRMYDDLKRNEGDNPTVGILLCEAKDQSVVRYSVLHGSEQLFASRYKLVLPSEDDLRAELTRDAEEIRLALALNEQGASNDQEKTEDLVRNTESDFDRLLKNADPLRRVAQDNKDATP